MSNKLISASLVCIAIGTSTAHAQDASQTTYKFSAFGTFSASHSSEKNGDYVPDGTLPQGAGRSHDWATGNDSRLGLQAFADFTPQIKGVLQVETEYDADNTYAPHVEWASLRYAFTSNLNVRVGRIGVPTFLNSDNRDVGYSYPWVHPPIELYRQLALSHSDGIDGSYRFYVGEATDTLKALYGSSRNDFPNRTTTSRDIWGVFNTVEFGDTSFRIGYQSRQDSTLSNSTGIAGPWIKDDDLSAGVSYDPGNWFLISEWLKRQSTIKKQAMYISSGIRMAQFTPYLTYSRDTAASFLPGFPPPDAAAVARARDAQSTVSFGTRWDFMKNVDLKVQYDRVKVSADSNGHLINVPSGVVLYGDTFHVFTVAVDFIY